MKRNILLAAFLMMTLTACQQFGGSATNNIRPSKTTSELVRTNLSLAIAYMQERDYEKSLEKLNRAEQGDPNYPPVYDVYGLLYQQLGQFDKAEQNYKKALSLDANASSILNNYGLLLCQQNRLDEAKEIFLRAANNPLYPTPEIALTNLGLCLDNYNQLEAAETYYRQALQSNPEIPEALIKMSELSFNNGEYLSARAYLQRYQAVAQHTSQSLWLGIQIERKLGDQDTVSSYALLLRNMFPDSAETVNLRKLDIR